MSRKTTRTIIESTKDDFGFPPTRKMLTYITAFAYLTTRNASWYADAASGFMLDPSSFLLEDQTEQRNKNVSVSSIKPWGIMHKYVFNGTTKKTFNDRLTLDSTSLNLKYDNLELNGLKEFLKHYVVNISLLEEDNEKSLEEDDESFPEWMETR
ncbi:8978_t:CDS:2 [Rhizophagus irregularis]|nr:8978_t:CDS:2 [Rhizophagus irregularis]